MLRLQGQVCFDEVFLPDFDLVIQADKLGDRAARMVRN